MLSCVHIFSENDREKSSTDISPKASDLKHAGVMSTLKNIITVAEKEDLLIDVTGNFKFDIVGNSTNTVFCSFENGN